MLSLQQVEAQLKSIGASFRHWGRPEVGELCHVLFENEKIKVCLNGRYSGGFAMLCATDQRLLLIDKKPFYLTVEDVRYDMVAEVDFRHSMMDATVCICTPGKKLTFTSLRQGSLRQLATYTQQRVMELRQQPQPQQEESKPQIPAGNLAEGYTQPQPAIEATTQTPQPQLRPMNPYTYTTLTARHRQWPRRN